MSDPFNSKVLNNSINPHREIRTKVRRSGKVEMHAEWNQPRVRRDSLNHSPLADRITILHSPTRTSYKVVSMISKRHDPRSPFPRPCSFDRIPFFSRFSFVARTHRFFPSRARLIVPPPVPSPPSVRHFLFLSSAPWSDAGGHAHSRGWHKPSDKLLRVFTLNRLRGRAERRSARDSRPRE